jgi:protein-L-isoaspartate(D-aspartate) O-methyltransferase
MTYETERNAMVAGQLIPRGINDSRVLEAFRKVPRHEFIPKEMAGEAYADYPLPIGEGQTISQPYMAALMTQFLKLTGAEKVLEIGTGSGYQAAILAELAKEVYSVERFDTLAEQARKTLGRLGYKNITIKTGDGTLGWLEHAPYDGIIVTASAPNVPDSLIRQLSETGRIAIPVGERFSQALTIVEKKKSNINFTEAGGCIFVPLIGKEGWKEG